MTIRSLTPQTQAQLAAQKAERLGAETKASLKAENSNIPEDISKDIGSTTPKSIHTDENGNTVFELNSSKGLKITRVSGGEYCDGPDTKWEVSSNDGTKRELTDDEKKALATNLDRNISGHDMKKREEELGRDMLRELNQDPAIDPRWDAPNQLKDLAMSEGKVTDRSLGDGLCLGRTTGPIEQLTLTNGNSAEIKVVREHAPNGPGSTPIFSKEIVSGDYPYQCKLSKDEAIALRDNLKKQGPKYRDTINDLNRYIRAQSPTEANDSFERRSSKEESYRRYTG